MVTAGRAHPRVGGENEDDLVHGNDVAGSSPRGRGKRRGGPPGRNKGGLIPAWAGKTMGHGRRHHDGQAHPRVGGENAAMMRSVLPIQGSSPRGRGKPSTRPCKHSRDSAHPRVGGENAEDQTRNVYEPGSSPRGRGKPRDAAFGPFLGGLIPAWAGKTWRGHAEGGRVRAHPRVGGENVSALTERRRPRRLIPAWAGKTDEVDDSRDRRRAHPRVGGENYGQQCAELFALGSSPRGRGKPHRTVGGARPPGLIPAWAGKTPQATYPIPGTRAHPRVGGENPYAASNDQDPKGSSPRGRGKRELFGADAERRGLIPAWAGKTGRTTR